MLESLLALGAGLIIGSFLNVCIYRLPRDLSVAQPARSYCPGCEHPIAWYDNIPLLSYLVLRGRCRHCRQRIPWRYPIVECLTALLFFLCVHPLGLTLLAAKYCLLCALLVGLVFADLEERILPDEFTLGGTLAGLILAWFVPVDDVIAHALLSMANVDWQPRVMSFAESLAGALVPTFFLWFGGYIYEKIRHKEGLGLGDVKMMAMIGAFLGLRASLLTLIAASVLGSIMGLLYILITRKDASSYELPFGTFLGAAGIVVALLGQRVIGWYAAQF